MFRKLAISLVAVYRSEINASEEWKIGNFYGIYFEFENKKLMKRA